MPLDDITGFNFKSLTTCVWNVIITLATVGYGEIFAESFFGRLIAIMICFWGVFFVSTLVVAVSEQLDFNFLEVRAYELLVRLILKKTIK
jgi:voltage-gated potassium channel Kch